MNGDACKFSHEPLTDESRQLLDKVSMYSFIMYFLCCIVNVTSALSSAVSYYFNVNIYSAHNVAIIHSVLYCCLL